MMSGSPSVDAKRRAFLFLMKALVSSASVQRKGWLSFVTSYNGLASSAKLGIQRQQKPADPRNSLISLLVVGVGIEHCLLMGF